MSSHNGDGKSQHIEPELLTAYALGELQGKELELLKSQLAQPSGAPALREVDEIRSLNSAVCAARSAEPLGQPSEQLRKAVAAWQEEVTLPRQNATPLATRRSRWPLDSIGLIVGGGVVLLVLAAMLMPASQMARSGSRRLAGYDAKESTRTSKEATAWAPAVERAKSVSPPRAWYLADNVETETQIGVELRLNAHGERAAAVRELDRINDSLAYNAQRGVMPGGAFTLGSDYGLAVPTDPEARRSIGGREQYSPILENRFLSPLQQPLSTFSIDVDTASYANVRRFLNSGRLPPVDAVRIEELVNYFKYDYPQPGNEAGRTGGTPVLRTSDLRPPTSDPSRTGETPILRTSDPSRTGGTPVLRTSDSARTGETPVLRAPFSVNMEVAECPWRGGHLLLRVGLKGREVARTRRPPSNLVFLLDVSGSMADENKLPLLKTAMKLLVGELGESDRVSIVTYAGDAGLKLPPTRGDQQRIITRAIESLTAGGSTNGSAGIELAYEQAAANFIQEGANRVILCTDGDLNVGVTSDAALVELIKKKAAGGTFLTVLGFGEGNLQDAKLEQLADNGNGLYAYIDSVREAKKVLVEQLTGSTITIAKDVKIQIEFNPTQVAAYRLLGYENRVLAAQDFNNDKKDAGEIGAGHTVTALYELAPAGAEDAATRPAVDPLKYQAGGSKFKVQGSKLDGPKATLNLEPGTLNSAAAAELLTLKLRYKEPDGDTSQLLEYPLLASDRSFHSASPDFQFAAAVASFGMILRGSEFRGSGNLAAVAEIAAAALGKDEGGYRAEFVDLVRKAQALK